MKKIICLLLCVTMISLCGCDIASFSSDLEDLLKSDGIARLVNADSDEIVTVETEILTVDEDQNLTCYQLLTDEQQRMYKIILASAFDMTIGWVNLGKCDKSYVNDMAIAYKAVTDDFPDIFWLPSTYLLGNSGKNKVVCFENTDGELQTKYNVSKTDCEDLKQLLNQTVDSIVAQAESYDTQFEKELFFHDYICENTVYEDCGELAYTSYGSIIDNKAVCEGYSKAFKLLCQRAGIKSVLINGKADNIGHMWNLVNLDGNWYQTDVTWDDTDDITSYAYFNITDKEMSEDHEISPNITELSGNISESKEIFNFSSYSCTAEDYNYFVRKGLIFDNNYSSTAAAEIILKNSEGKNSAQLKFQNIQLKDDFESTYQTYADNIQRNINKRLGKSSFDIKNVATDRDIVTFFW